MIRLLDYPPIASCLIRCLVEVDERNERFPPAAVHPPARGDSHPCNTRLHTESLRPLSRLASWYKRLPRHTPDPTRMSLHQLYTLTSPLVYQPIVSGRSAATPPKTAGVVWPLARTCKAAYDVLAVELYRTWRVKTDSSDETLIRGLSPRARECIRYVAQTHFACTPSRWQFCKLETDQQEAYHRRRPT